MKNILSYICLVVMGGTLFSCLDDETAPLDPTGSKNVIEFYDNSVPISPAGAIYPAWVTSFGVSPEATFEQTISFSGANDNDKNIEITLAVDPIALEDYNEQMAELSETYQPYEILPESNYSIPNMTVTIPAGQTKANVTITVFPDKFDLSKNYAIPLRIQSASHGILSAHFSVAILATVVKNKYDGVYTVSVPEGYTNAQGMVDVTNAAFSGVYPKTVELRTVNGNTVNYYDQEYSLQGHIFNTGDGASYWGGFAAQFQFDESNQVISVVNALGQGNNNRSGKLDAAQPSAPVMEFEADGVTPKTMTIWYIMRQENTATDRAFWKEVYTYVGPRD